MNNRTAAQNRGPLGIGRQQAPLLYLLLVSVTWALYYRHAGPLNDYGQANFEWLYFIDGLVIAPALCWYLATTPREGTIRALALGSLAAFIGSFIIPDESKILWPYLENARFLVIAVVVLVELAAISTVIFAIRLAVQRQRDPDHAISQAIGRFLSGPTAELLAFDLRMWTFALCGRHIEPRQYAGDLHFSYHRKDGAQQFLQGFAILIALELPLAHLFLHFVWSPLAAQIISALTLLGLIFFIGEYRAVSRRPISLTDDTLIIRYGLYPVCTIAISDISIILENKEHISRSRSLKRYNYVGIPNVLIHLRNPQNRRSHIYLGVDDGSAFIAAIRQRMNKGEQAQHPQR